MPVRIGGVMIMIVIDSCAVVVVRSYAVFVIVIVIGSGAVVMFKNWMMIVVMVVMMTVSMMMRISRHSRRLMMFDVPCV